MTSSGLAIISTCAHVYFIIRCVCTPIIIIILIPRRHSFILCQRRGGGNGPHWIIIFTRGACHRRSSDAMQFHFDLIINIFFIFPSISVHCNFDDFDTFCVITYTYYVFFLAWKCESDTYAIRGWWSIQLRFDDIAIVFLTFLTVSYFNYYFLFIYCFSTFSEFKTAISRLLSE